MSQTSNQPTNHTTPPDGARTGSSRLFYGMIFVLLLLVAVVWLFFRPNPNPTIVKDDDKSEPTNYIAPSYDVKSFARAEGSWNVAADKSFEKLMASTLGATATQDDALDFYANHAARYRYHAQFEPPLYVIDSKDIFEIAWYYAHAKDSQSDKQASLNYAKKAYVLSDYLLDNPADLFDKMLNNTSRPKQTDAKGLPSNPSVTDLPKGVIFANCANYMCQIVFDKRHL